MLLKGWVSLTALAKSSRNKVGNEFFPEGNKSIHQTGKQTPLLCCISMSGQQMAEASQEREPVPGLPGGRQLPLKIPWFLEVVLRDLQ